MNEEELEKKVKEFFKINKTKRTIAVKDDTYKRLLELQAQMIQQKKERVSLSELIHFLIDFYREAKK
jgi:predicted CopG family antitoxin